MDDVNVVLMGSCTSMSGNFATNLERRENMERMDGT